MNLHSFVAAQLPSVPARVLEVGCGRGELARAVASRGYEVVAIDPNAPPGEIFRAVSLEELVVDETFDAVVASRALHHIPDLPGSVAKIASLLRPRGRLILAEHACDRLDDRTASWYLEQRGAHDPDAPSSTEACLADWEANHAELHGYAAMRKALDRRFTERFFTWTPYLYGELPGVEEEEERALIERDAITAIGFRYVGEPRAAPSVGLGRQKTCMSRSSWAQLGSNQASNPRWGRILQSNIGADAGFAGVGSQPPQRLQRRAKSSWLGVAEPDFARHGPDRAAFKPLGKAPRPTGLSCVVSVSPYGGRQSAFPNNLLGCDRADDGNLQLLSFQNLTLESARTSMSADKT